MSGIDDVVARVRERVTRWGVLSDERGMMSADADTLLAAYESAVRERDEARAKCEAYRSTLNDYERDIGNVQADRDRARAALRRVREGVEREREVVRARHPMAPHSGGSFEDGFDSACDQMADAVLAILDREAPDEL